MQYWSLMNTRWMVLALMSTASKWPLKDSWNRLCYNQVGSNMTAGARTEKKSASNVKYCELVYSVHFIVHCVYLGLAIQSPGAGVDLTDGVTISWPHGPKNLLKPGHQLRFLCQTHLFQLLRKHLRKGGWRGSDQNPLWRLHEQTSSAVLLPQEQKRLGHCWFYPNSPGSWSS